MPPKLTKKHLLDRFVVQKRAPRLVAKKSPPSPRWTWEVIAQVMLSVVPPGKGSPKLVIMINPQASPYMVAAETAADEINDALAAHKHQVIGPVGDLKEAIVRAEIFAHEWLKGKGFPVSDCVCDDIHPGTKLRPVRPSRKKPR